MAFPIYTALVHESKSKSFHPTNPLLADLVSRAVQAYPGEEARIRRGAEIVERDGVRVKDDGMYLVGIHHYYPVNGHCVCPDAAHRPAGSAGCKHKWAKTLYRKLHAAPAAPVRTLQFYASMANTMSGWVGGVATVWQDGKIEFVEHDTTAVIACSIEEVVLGGRKDLIDAARQSA